MDSNQNRKKPTLYTPIRLTLVSSNSCGSKAVKNKTVATPETRKEGHKTAMILCKVGMVDLVGTLDMLTTVERW
jgi:hypothetical protein